MKHGSLGCEMAKTRFQQKRKDNQDVAPPRIAVIGEGETENGLPVFLRKFFYETQYQVLSKVRKISNSDSIPPAKIAKDIRRLTEVILELRDAEYVVCVIDLEARGMDWQDFRSEILANNPGDAVVGVVSRSIESWMLGHIDGMVEAVRPTKTPNASKYKLVDNIAHPSENVVKAHWKDYSKSRDGVKFLNMICPFQVSRRSRSCRQFLVDMEEKFNLRGRVEGVVS